MQAILHKNLFYTKHSRRNIYIICPFTWSLIQKALSKQKDIKLLFEVPSIATKSPYESQIYIIVSIYYKSNKPYSNPVIYIVPPRLDF